MSAKEPDGRAAEVLRLHYLEGASVRLISRKMGLARRTVRQILGRKPSMPEAPRAPRSRSLDPYLSGIALFEGRAVEKIEGRVSGFKTGRPGSQLLGRC